MSRSINGAFALQSMIEACIVVYAHTGVLEGARLGQVERLRGELHRAHARRAAALHEEAVVLLWVWGCCGGVVVGTQRQLSACLLYA